MTREEYIQQELSYNPETGELSWNRSESGRKNTPGVIGTHGYLAIELSGYGYLAHRLAWLLHYGVWPDGNIDHINRDKLDNRLVNLRTATRSDNGFNAKLREDNTSGFKGVVWVKRESKWKAYITVWGKRQHLGTFWTREEAAGARWDAEQMLGVGQPSAVTPLRPT